MFAGIRKYFSIETWTLRGYDTFAGDSYHLPGWYLSEAAAGRAAQKQLKQLERNQPSEISGGQTGIQDQVFVVPPDGSAYRYLPEG